MGLAFVLTKSNLKFDLTRQTLELVLGRLTVF